MSRRSPARAVLLAALMFVSRTPASAADADETSALDAATRATCDSRLVFLGETANHDSGGTIRVKSELARRLIEHCHFDTIVFESSMVEFLELDRRAAEGETISAQEIDDAVGGLWSYTAEFQPFAAFLADYRRSHRLTIAGMDDQTGTSTAHYAPDGLARDLLAVLPAPARATCAAALAVREAHSLDPSRPYAATDKKQVQDCLQSVDAQWLVRNSPADQPLRATTASFARFVARDLTESEPWSLGYNERDRSMSLNLQWQLSRLRKGSKAIVWAATTHLQRPPAEDEREAMKIVPMGWHIAQETDSRPTIIAISSLGGTTGRHKVAPLSAAPVDALEALALHDRSENTAFLDAAALRAAGRSPSRMIAGAFERSDWSHRVDGLLVIREDHPVTLLR